MSLNPSMALTLSGTPWGVEAALVQIDVAVRRSAEPHVQILGLPETAHREIREAGVLAGHGSFSRAEPDRLADHLRAVLRDTALQGPSFPHSFLDHADDETLILLAADLWNERQALILGTR